MHCKTIVKKRRWASRWDIFRLATSVMVGIVFCSCNTQDRYAQEHKPSIPEASPTKAALDPAIIATVENEIRKMMEKEGVPGLSIAIGWEGEIRYSQAFGLADIENQVPVRKDTHFRTASIAKALTATAVMRLVENGQIDLDENIRKYVRTFPKQDKPILVRHLLNHQSGIRHYDDWTEAVGTKSYENLRASLELFSDDDLVQKPGKAFR